MLSFSRLFVTWFRKSKVNICRQTYENKRNTLLLVYMEWSKEGVLKNRTLLQQ